MARGPAGNGMRGEEPHQSSILWRSVRQYLVLLASWLPNRLLRYLDGLAVWPRDEAEFSFWTDVHYWKYCRKDRKDNPMVGDGTALEKR